MSYNLEIDKSNLLSFEVFRSEESNTIDSIALGQFVVALENTGLRR